MSSPKGSAPSYVGSSSPRGLSAVLALSVFAILFIHVCLQTAHYCWQRLPWLLKDRFDVDVEDSVPTWFSAANLLLCSRLFFAIATEKKRAGDRWYCHWYGLSFFSAMLSVDEVAGFHEVVDTIGIMPWTIPGTLVAATFGLAYARFLIHLPAQTRRLFIVAGVLFATGALGVEQLTDIYLEDNSTNSLGYNLLTATEEGLEMIGVVLFIHALLSYQGTTSPIPPPVGESESTRQTTASPLGGSPLTIKSSSPW